MRFEATLYVYQDCLTKTSRMRLDPLAIQDDRQRKTAAR